VICLYTDVCSAEVGDHFIYSFYICHLFTNAVSSSASNVIFIVQIISYNNSFLAVVYTFSNMQHVSPAMDHHHVSIIKMLRENFNV